jgi:hypothetical protein
LRAACGIGFVGLHGAPRHPALFRGPGGGAGVEAMAKSLYFAMRIG